MKNPLTIILMFGTVIAALAFTYSMHATPAPKNVVCAEQRLVEFGWTSESPALAEMAAIMRWQKASARREPGYAQWHLARNRHLSCREIAGSGNLQCRIAALPCRYEENGGAE